MRVNQYNSIAIWLALPLAVFSWQNSSCRSANSNASNTTVNANNRNANQQQDLRGQWGGDHISMEVTETGAQIEYDCAHGTITEKIAPDRNGKFEVKGMHSPEHGGPVRRGEKNEQPAVYRGSITNDTMKLEVKLTESNESVGTFTLTRGNEGRVLKCK
jgi:hypothetical protein